MLGLSGEFLQMLVDFYEEFVVGLLEEKLVSFIVNDHLERAEVDWVSS